MAFREISRFLSRYLFYFTLILCLPLGVAILYDFFLETATHSTTAFALTMGVSLLLASVFFLFGRHATGNFYRRESILIVAVVWLITPAISALPFLFSHTLEKPLDAYFEAMSGLTTTGSTIFHAKSFDPEGVEIPIHQSSLIDPNISYTFYGTVAPLRNPLTHEITEIGIEAVAKPLLFWRSFMQWIGGMGIVVLFITILPALSMGGRLLFEAEVAGPTKEGMTPRIKETGSLLWRIYLGLTVFQVILLLLFNPSLPFFDAINLTLSTISTGGFSVRNEGLSAYHSLSIDWIVVAFMILGSINFTLYFHCLRRKVYRIYEPEFFTFMLTLFCGSLLMSALLFLTKGGIVSFSEALKNGIFHAVSAQTSTGFAITNYDLWPFAPQVLLLILMFLGGMSGSTAGGIKIIRHLILFRFITHKIESIFRPEAVRCLKVGKREITDKTAITVFVFFCILIAFSVFGTFLVILDGIDPNTSMGLVASMINNGGMSFNAAGPSESCAFLPPLSKGISIIWMALGRLEFFILLVLLVPAFWRNR